MNTDFSDTSSSHDSHSFAVARSAQLFGDLSEHLSHDAQRDAIVEHITRLLTENPERLMHVLYRIDVSESLVRDVLHHSQPDDVAEHLTDLIVRRMEEKIVTRNNYRTSSDELH